MTADVALPAIAESGGGSFVIVGSIVVHFSLAIDSLVDTPMIAPMVDRLARKAGVSRDEALGDDGLPGCLLPPVRGDRRPAPEAPIRATPPFPPIGVRVTSLRGMVRRSSSR